MHEEHNILDAYFTKRMVCRTTLEILTGPYKETLPGVVDYIVDLEAEVIQLHHEVQLLVKKLDEEGK